MLSSAHSPFVRGPGGPTWSPGHYNIKTIRRCSRRRDVPEDGCVEATFVVFIAQLLTQVTSHPLFARISRYQSSLGSNSAACVPHVHCRMSAAMLSSSLLAAPAKLSSKHIHHSRRTSPICASYRSGFNANDAFKQAAKQFQQFQKQQQSQQRSQGRSNPGKTEAFGGSFGPFEWNFDADEINKFMEVAHSYLRLWC